MTTEYKSFLTDEVKALIGVETEWSRYSEPISGSEVRRFVHAIMDDNPLYYDEAYARSTKYGAPVCPPLYASFAFRRAVREVRSVPTPFSGKPERCVARFEWSSRRTFVQASLE